MDFSEALLHLKAGRKLRRRGWEEMFISMTAGATVPADKIWSPHNRKFAQSLPGREVAVLPSITLCDEGLGHIMMGWVPSQEDIFVEDWEIILEDQDFAGLYMTPPGVPVS